MLVCIKKLWIRLSASFFFYYVSDAKDNYCSNSTNLENLHQKIPDVVTSLVSL